MNHRKTMFVVSGFFFVALAALAVYRGAFYAPAPGVDQVAVEQWEAETGLDLPLP